MKAKQQRISAEQVIGRILDLVRANPKAAKDLPEGCRSREFWKDLFAKTRRTGRLLEMLRELPAFTNQAPRSRAGWAAVMRKDFKGPAAVVPKQAAFILQHIVKSAKPIPPRRPVKYWRDQFGPDEFLQRVRPTESDEYLPNPHRGTTTFQRFQGDDTYASWLTSDTHGPIEFAPDAPVQDNAKYIPRTTLTYCRWPWRLLEPRKGRYNWAIVDKTLEVAHNRGQTAQLRFQPYTARVDFRVEPTKAKRHPPRVSVNVPDWYWDTGAKWVRKGAYAPNEPDSNDPKYLKHFGDFIRAFARRYDGHPDVESIDMAYAGFWGESGGNSTPRTAAKLTDVYLRSFKKTHLMSMLGTPGCNHAARKTRGTSHHIGWRADCFGDLRKAYGYPIPPELCWNHTFDQYPKEIALCGVTDAWKTAPVTMETCGNVATWFMDDYDLDVIIREGYRYHMSVFMPKNVFFPAEFMDRLIEFDKKIGYRFAVRQIILPLECRPGERVKTTFFIDNVGCAPIYRPYPLALRFRQGKTSRVVHLKADIRTWMPGHTWFEETITAPAGLKRGEVKVDLAIVDDKDNPKVWFAIAGEKVDDWHPLSSMDVI